MTPERWRRITEVFEAALERHPTQRHDFLAEVCEGDEALRLEVESLISEDRQAGSFIAEPVLDANVALANPVNELSASAIENVDLTGQRLGSYSVLERLGEGWNGGCL